VKIESVLLRNPLGRLTDAIGFSIVDVVIIVWIIGERISWFWTSVANLSLVGMLEQRSEKDGPAERQTCIPSVRVEPRKR
jgi:hypothetical protein